MSSKRANAPEDISFEDGYEELKALVARIGRDDVGVDEKFEDFRRGKGLERALRGYLGERQGELAEIEDGKNLPEFRIVAPSSSPGRATSGRQSAEVDDHDFRPVPAANGSSAGDEDIPF